MKTTESGWYQVAINPDEENVEALLAAANEAADADPTPVKESPWLTVKEFVSKLLHPLGVHHFVPLKRWDQGSQRIINTGHLICLWCPRAKEA